MRFPQRPPDLASLLDELFESGRWTAVAEHRLPTLPDGRYLHWDELRRRPAPRELTSEQWWACTKWARNGSKVPVRALQQAYPGIDFGFVALPSVQRALHAFDRVDVARDLLAAVGHADALTEHQVDQLIEESISSSTLEGARPTTRELARQMVREQRAPGSHDERMILNNWRAMEHILQLREAGASMCMDDLLELHRILGEGALEVPEGAGVFRGPEHVVVVSDAEGTVWHTPPNAEGLRERMEALLDFADGGSEDATVFIHPVIRAILVHFWIGYEHPFRDGNGRIARALFYYCMLRHGYDMARYLSISAPIDRSPKAYYSAFAHCETDDGDLTYFLLHQLDVMQQAQLELGARVARRVEHLHALDAALAGFDTLNSRQRALLQHAMRHRESTYTIEGHATSHRVHYQTARNDIVDLITRKYLVATRVGRAKRYRVADKVFAKLQRAS